MIECLQANYSVPILTDKYCLLCSSHAMQLLNINLNLVLHSVTDYEAWRAQGNNSVRMFNFHPFCMSITCILLNDFNGIVSYTTITKSYITIINQ